MNSTNRILVAFLMAAMTLAVPADSFAQLKTRSVAERRQRPGKGFWANQRTSRNIRHARDYSSGLYMYSRRARAVDPAVAKSESENLGRNIECAKKELTVVQQIAKMSDDKETLKTIDTINKHLANAAETHKALHEECCRESPDGTVASDCCSDITKELEKAMAEHDALMRKLSGKAAEHSAGKEPEKAATESLE